VKIVIRLVLILVVLGALAGAGWYGYQHFYKNGPPGGAGRNMEIRLLALNGAVPSNGVGPGVDVFQKDDVSSYIANGDAPNGWKWFPLANGVDAEVTRSAPAGSDNPYITRTNSGQMFLLTADSPDMTLTHASGVHPWGVESVRVETDELGPSVSITLDQAGGDLMHDFTQKYLGHRIAVVVGGQICEVALIQSPVRSGIVVRLPVGQEAQAEALRDSLMK
jgi:preprotein translocase subunit SecD